MPDIAYQGATQILSATATDTGSAYQIDRRISGNQKRTFQASGTTSSGSGAATILIEVSNDETNWLTLGTITLTLGTSSTTDGFTSDAPWAFVRARVSAISGTDAAVTAYIGV